jgi:HEAT repeat protein
MNRLVTISLLEHQSVTERLRGASYSRLTPPDERVLAALLGTAAQDPNINVRLAAVEALTPYANRPSVRSGLLDSLSSQRSPLVQLAVLEAVVGDDGIENGELERLLRSGGLDESVLEHVLGERAQSL